MTMLEETAKSPILVARWQSFALAALWFGFIVYGARLAPPSDPDTLEVIQQLSTGQWETLNPAVVVLFNCMGLWPLIYASLALDDGRHQAIAAWPFVLGSFGFGAFALMPYLALRKPTRDLPYLPADSRLLRGITHRLFGVGVAIAFLLLMVYGWQQGAWTSAWSNFCKQFLTSQFIHVMSLDFSMLTLLTPTLLWDDIARRTATGWRRVLWRCFSLVPLVGPALYLALRPTSPKTDS